MANSLHMKGGSELLVGAIERIEEEIAHHGYIGFRPEGVKIPKDDSEPEFMRYCGECIEMKVKPFSSSVFGYDKGKRIFLPRRVDIEHDSMRHLDKYGDDTGRMASRASVKGVKASKITLSIQGYPKFFDFAFLQENFLDAMVEQGYDIDGADIWLSSYTTGYQGNEIAPSTELIYNGTDLIFRRGDHLDDLNEKQVAWFEALKRQFSM